MATTPDPNADKTANSNDSSASSPSPSPTPASSKDSSPAQPETVAPSNEGVQVGGLSYTSNVDGTRTYPEQKPVKTEDDPTPQPESDAQAAPDAPKPTDAPAGS